MAVENLCNVYKVVNRDPDFKFDCENLKKILFDKQIKSELAEFEDGWLIRTDCSSAEVITKCKNRLHGEIEDRPYFLVFEPSTTPFPELFPSSNQSCTGNPKGTILVTNYPPGTTAGELLHFFESVISYGGTIQHIHFEEDNATITFSKPEVADIVCSKSPILFKETLINIHKDTYNIKVPAKKNGSQIATKTICVSNVPKEMDLENLEVFFQNKKNGGGKMEKKPTRDLQTNAVEITFVEEETAKRLVEKSSVTYNKCTLTITLKKPFTADKVAENKSDNFPLKYDQKTIVVDGVPENITADEVMLYFKNFKSSKGGKIKDLDDDRKKGIKITFASSDIAKNVLAKCNHKIGGNLLKVRLYIPPQMEEKQLLISDIKHNALDDSLRNFLEVDVDLDVDQLKMIQPGVWLVYCENKIDFEKVKTTCKEVTRKFISETYPKVKQVELTDKIIIRNIPENYSMDSLENYFAAPLHPDHFVSLKMLPGKRCIVTFKDYNIASQWSKVQHNKFDCDLYYDYEDENEMYMDINISSAFKLQFIMSHKQVFEDELKDCGSPVWCESLGNSLKLLLNKGIKEQEIERKVKVLLETIFEEELSISPNIFPELKETYNHESDAVHVYFDDNNHMVRIFSFNKSLAAEYKGKMLSIVESKSNIKEELELAPHKMSLLFADLFPSKIFKTYKMLKITKETKKIILTGSVSDISNVTREIYKYLSELSSTQCPLPHHASEIVTKKKVKEYLQKNVKKDNLICSWEINPEKQLIIYALNNKNLMSAKNIFQKSFMELNFDLTDPIKKTMKGDKWQTFLKKMSTKYIDIFHIDDQQKEKISIVTTKEFSQDIGTDFGTFFDTNVIYTSTLPLKCGFYDFLKTFCMTNIKRFCEDHMPVTIDFQDDQTIHISATNQVNNDASDFLKNLTKSIIEKSEMISYLGFKKFLKTDAADSMFRKLSQTYQCIILKEEEIKPNNIGKRSSADFEIKYANSSILLHMGDITELEVDAIVNPANKQLQHIGGLAKLISEKGGPAIQTRCKEIMAQKNSLILREGSVEVTTAGMLKSKIIIHAVGPTWKDGNNYEVDSLSEAVTSSLQAAAQNNCSSIAIPAISTGIFRFPIDKATEVIVSNIKEYLDNYPQSILKSIYLVSITENIISAFKRQLQSIFPGFATLPKENNDSYKWVKPPIPQKPTKTVEKATPSRTKIEIELGLLNKTKCDVIVNTTNSSLDLRSGAISKAILADAGEELQAECYQHSLKPYDIVVTAGYKLPCTKVFHVSLPHWSQSSIDLIKTNVRNCLVKADALGFSEIAFPAFGTGNLRYPADVVASAMFSAASEYISDTGTGLQKISFVIYPTDTLIKTAFENANSGGTLVSDVPYYDLPTNENAATSNVLPTSNVLTQDILNADINGIKLIVLKGNIIDENVDIIVHGTNQHFTLNGAVSKALLGKMGHQLTNDCKAKSAEMQSHNYAITKASSLAAAYILHINMEGIKKNADKVFKLCFTAAENEKMTSLALPPLGTGGLGCSIQDITKNFLIALKNFSSKSSPNYLKTVKFVIFESAMFTEVCKIIGHETQTLFEKVKSHIPFLNRTQTKTDQTEGLSKGNMSPSPVKLFFYANSLPTVNKTKEDIISQYKSKYLISKEIQDINIPELPRQQMQNIMKLQCEHEVKIEINFSKITINGYKDDVLSVTGDIQEMILSFVNDIKTEQNAQLIQRIVQWNYITYDQNKSNVVAYPRDINQQLEEAYTNNKMLKINRGNARIVFDLRKPEEMIEYDESNPSKTIKIVRNDKTQGVSLPEHWSAMGNNNYLKVELKPGDEYDKVKNAFPSNFQIVKIERIQNKSLYIQYQARLEQVNVTNPKGTVNETQGLWHGTSEGVIEKINSDGFDRSYCGKNATAYGQGVYFATDAQYSLGSTYSPPNNNGHKHIYMCNLITGLFCQGSPNLRHLPDNPQYPGTKFHSSVNDLNAPSIYVIFHDSSAYPAYLITCK